MNQSIATFVTPVVAAVVVIVVVSLAAATTVYAQNTTIVNLNNATNTTISISGLNASKIIIDAVNAKVRAIYDHGNIDIPTNSDSVIITKVDNTNTPSP